MTYPEFEKDRRLQEAAAEYTAKFGGRFGGEEPGVRLMYAPDDEDTAYTPPENATADRVLQDIKSGTPLQELWPELEYDPDLLY